jgi:pimeloyl-ACP methyl ester carboxylesterase
VCATYVPLYRQAKIGSYLARGERQAHDLAVAFSDVADAFLHYLSHHNHGRPIVLVGHSQGGEMVVRLLKRYFDEDPALRARLVLAMPIGAQVEVPRGRTVGATLTTIPLCTQAGQVGCVVTYRTFLFGVDFDTALYRPAAGNETACVDPADDALAPDAPRGAWQTFAGTWLPVGGALGLDGTRDGDARGNGAVKTPFVRMPALFTGRCLVTRDGVGFLAISAPGARDWRAALLDLGSWRFRTKLGLHVLDMQIPHDELIDMVRRRVRALPAPPPLAGSARVD